MKKLLFQDSLNKKGMKLAMELKEWCDNQDCASCVFACDADGTCQLKLQAPYKWDEDEIYDEATCECEPSEKYE